MGAVHLECDLKLVDYFDRLDRERMVRAQERRGIEYYRKRKERKEGQKKREAARKKMEAVSYKSGGF